MTEPVYRFEKGVGWLPIIGAYILTVEDCAGNWFSKVLDGDKYRYPEICRDWMILERCSELKVGDIIPYGERIQIVYKILDGKAYVHGYVRNEGFTEHCTYVNAFGSWYGVARRYE